MRRENAWPLQVHLQFSREPDVMSQYQNKSKLASSSSIIEPATPAPEEPRPAPNLDTRFTLRAREAAKAFGISERKLRQISSRLPAVRIDGLVLYPVDGLRRWLEEETGRQQASAESMANGILKSLRDKS